MVRTNVPYSVLMSVYRNDAPEYLDAAIRSMVDQTVAFHDFVIVCDGPIGRELQECLETWEQRLGNRLRVERLSENGGLGHALAVGLPLCRCDIVARMDADDISRSDRCEKLIAAMSERGLVLVGGAIEEFNETPGDMGVVRELPLESGAIRRFAVRRNPFNHMTVIFSKKAVEEVGGYESFHLMEDYWLWVRMLMEGFKVGNIDEVVVDARTGDGMYDRRSNIQYLKSQVQFFTKLRELGFISRMEAARAITERTLATILPTGAVKTVYNRFLRRSS